MNRIPTQIIIFSLLFFTSPIGILAENTPSAVNLPVEGKPSEGSIVSKISGVYSVTNKAYDSALFGVVTSDPQVSFNKETDQSVPIVSSGQALVRVSTKNGKIKAGDSIASSDQSGVGQKASAEGYVLGKALADFSNESEGKIYVLINIHFVPQSSYSDTSGGLFGFLRSDAFPRFAKILFALAIGLAAFVFGLLSISRLSKAAVEAEGRNPLAKKSINAGTVLYSFSLGLISLLGVGVAIYVFFFT